jgi:hypothetical protein
MGCNSLYFVFNGLKQFSFEGIGYWQKQFNQQNYGRALNVVMSRGYPPSSVICNTIYFPAKGGI